MCISESEDERDDSSEGMFKLVHINFVNYGGTSLSIQTIGTFRIVHYIVVSDVEDCH